jgi:very-long-chain enoyl-CoA reductase
MSTVTVRYGAGRSETVSVEPFTTVLELKQRVCEVFSLPVNQIRLSILSDKRENKVLQDEYQVASYGTGLTLLLKNLGRQIGWRTVFVLEYLGALLLYPMFMLAPVRNLVYSSNPAWQPGPVQQLALGCWIGHYIKRELETLLIHRFSKGTMPLLNLFKNSGYYWAAAVAISFFVNHPLYSPPHLDVALPALICFVVFELLNLVTHVQLASFRSGDDDKRLVIPRGILWDFVTCPNYTFEIFAWLSFAAMTSTAAAYLFALVGFLQMLVWAKQKHSRLCVAFPPADGKDRKEVFPARKKLLFPFVL